MKKLLLLLAFLTVGLSAPAFARNATVDPTDKLGFWDDGGNAKITVDSNCNIQQTGTYSGANTLIKTSLKNVRFAVGNSGTALALSTSTSLTTTNLPNTYNLVTSSGGALTVGSTPTIATTTATTGDIFIIQSTTATVTFSDNGTVSGTLLELGSTTRALGVGDILVLIYQGGSWWEMGFYNN